jgi:hypothetical protein
MLVVLIVKRYSVQQPTARKKVVCAKKNPCNWQGL